MTAPGYFPRKVLAVGTGEGNLAIVFAGDEESSGAEWILTPHANREIVSRFIRAISQIPRLKLF